MKSLSATDFAEDLGVPVESLPACSLERLATADFRYAEIGWPELGPLVAHILGVLEAELPVAGPDRLAAWEEGWTQNLREYLETGALDALIPKYLLKNGPLRHRGRYITPASQRFEADYYMAACQALFHKHLAGATSVIDFGCGTGLALAMLSEMFPGTPLIGCDWSKASQDILEAIKSKTGKPIRGINFNMACPHDVVPFTEGCAVITILAMEQLGEAFGPFLDYLLAQRPGICLHLEPIIELYDPTDLLDLLAIRYHRKRGYLTGFLTELERLRGEGRVSLLDARRLRFGSLFHEAYSVVVWRPL